MDHAYIESHGLIELYHQGALTPDEESRFEEHFVDCGECMEQLELARGLQRGLRSVAAEDAARINRALVRADIDVTGLRQESRTLEEVFLQLTGQSEDAG